MTPCSKQHLCVLARVFGSGFPAEGCLHISSAVLLSDTLSCRFSFLLTSLKCTHWSREGLDPSFCWGNKHQYFNAHFLTHFMKMFINIIFFSYLTLSLLHIIQCTKGWKNSYILLYVSESDDGFMKCMELSLEDWFPILPRSWLHLYSMPVALWPLVLLWCGRQKHKPGWSGEREGRGIAKGETVYNGRGGLRFFSWCRFQREMRGWDEGVQKGTVWVCKELCDPMKPSSDRSVRVCTKGGLVVGG